MAILAVLVAIASCSGTALTRKSSAAKLKPTDQWGFYQAKNIRLHVDEFAASLMGVVEPRTLRPPPSSRKNTPPRASATADELKDIQSEAKKLEEEVAAASTRANRYD